MNWISISYLVAAKSCLMRRLELRVVVSEKAGSEVAIERAVLAYHGSAEFAISIGRRTEGGGRSVVV